MKIGIDLRPLQTQQSRNRGIGIYIHSQVTALLSILRQDDILLFYTSHQEPPDLVKTMSPGAQWQAIPLAVPVEDQGTFGMPTNADDDFRQMSALQFALSDYNLDVFHITSPFEWETAVGQAVGTCRMVATLYDLIPVVYAPIYLSPASPQMRQLYLHRLRLLVQADRLMAISEASRRDAIELLGISPNRIDLVSAGADACFKPLSDTSLPEAARAKFRLPEQYILSVLGYHYTKNIEGALAAYGLLPQSLRRKVGLTIVCRLTDNARQAVLELARQYGVQDQVVLTGEIDQSDLVALYNGAMVVFYPSRYDGFGLPVLEAMRCGTPVVTSTSSSLPEVGGEAVLLSDPDDHQGLAAKLELVLTNPDLRQELREKGFSQAQRFTWRQVAEATLNTYHKAVKPPPSTIVGQPPRPNIAYWSPLNPCKSGISDYSEHLLPHLARYVDIDLYVEGYVPTTAKTADRFAVFDHHLYPSIASNRHYDVSLYQMGNSLFHEYIYRTLLASPGIVVLHDYSLQGFMYSLTEARGQRQRYLDEVEHSEGLAVRREVERHMSGEGGSRQDLYAYPLNRRVIESSLGVIVHSEWMRQQLQKQESQVPIAVVPHGVKVFPNNEKQRALLRSSLGLAPDTLVVGCFGRIAPTKRIEVVIRAFSRLHTVVPRSVLFLVGSPGPGMKARIEKAAIHCGVGDSLRVTGYVTERAFDAYLQVSDVCINLRYPSAGETSGTLCRALGAGLPVLATNLEQFAEFPEKCVRRVDVGENEEDELVAHLHELATYPHLRRQMGQAAQEYVMQHATWPRVAAQYAGFIGQVIDGF